jgi:hypothetical protein
MAAAIAGGEATAFVVPPNRIPSPVSDASNPDLEEFIL